MKPDSGQKLRETAARKKLEESHESLFPTDSPDPMIGKVLRGHLEILSCLGRGGMSVVYKAKDLLQNRMVAVKVLLPHGALDAKSVARFRQEAMAASSLNHPNIIHIYEFNIPDDGQPYLVMDYIEGQSLADLINTNGAIELQRAISIMTLVCDGLEHAHKGGVIHRDLKPGNIMLMKDESGKQTVKIVDFGIAKLLETEDGHALTQTGEVFGSPMYMSPEQCSGAKSDSRSDIYSLGCVMFEMVTGKPPFKGATILETIQMQTSQSPKSVRDAHPGIKIPDHLDLVLLKALAKDPAQRFQTAEEFRSALKTLDTTARGGLIEKAKLRLRISGLKKTEKKVSFYLLIAGFVGVIVIIVAWIITYIYIDLKMAEYARTAKAIQRQNEIAPAPENLSKLRVNFARSCQFLELRRMVTLFLIPSDSKLVESLYDWLAFSYITRSPVDTISAENFAAKFLPHARTHGANSPQLASYYKTMGWICLRKEDPINAQKSFTRSLEIYKSLIASSY